MAHQPPRYPRPSTPNPTVPPPLPPTPLSPSDPAQHLASRLEPWKALVAVAVVLVGAGVTWATWASQVAMLSDVSHARQEASTNLSTSTAGAMAQLGALQVQQQALAERMSRVEGGLNVMAGELVFLRDQLIEIAKATGAHRVDP